MATIVFPKQQMVAGARRVTEEILVPSGLAFAKVELDMNAVELRDPTTHVKGILEVYDPTALVPQWRLLASTRLLGNPDNSIQDIPFIRVDGQTLADLHARGAFIRGVVEALSDGNYGATLTWQ